MPAAGNFPAYSQLFAGFSSPLAGKGTWHLLPITPAVLPTTTKHFDRAELLELPVWHHLQLDDVTGKDGMD